MAAPTGPPALPTFLGVHTLALSEELTLDGGALRVWTGAAEHHDPTADSATTPGRAAWLPPASQPPSRSQPQRAGGAFGDGSLEARGPGLLLAARERPPCTWWARPGQARARPGPGLGPGSGSGGRRS